MWIDEPTSEKFEDSNESIFQVILVGNKSDMEDERVISYERGKQLADSLGLEFFETSAKENVNVRVSNCHYFRNVKLKVWVQMYKFHEKPILLFKFIGSFGTTPVKTWVKPCLL